MVGSGTLAFLTPVVRVGGAIASAGVLLSLMAGIGRTTLAMAGDHELPAWLGAVHPRFRVPHRAELALGVVVIVIVLITDVRGAIGFSSFTVLAYYAIANAAAFTLAEHQSPHRGRLRTITIIGLLGCVALAFTLPPGTIVAGIGVLAAGVGGRAVLHAVRRTR